MMKLFRVERKQTVMVIAKSADEAMSLVGNDAVSATAVKSLTHMRKKSKVVS